MNFVCGTVVVAPQTLCCPPVGDPSLDEDTIDDLVVMLKALADPTRLQLVNLIAGMGEGCACDLPEAVGKSQPTVSHHLSVLVKAGLLDREQRGKWAWFSVREEQLDALGAVFANRPASPNCC